MEKEFFSVALPIMLTIFVAVWAAIFTNNKRLGDLLSTTNRRFDDLASGINRRFDEVNVRLKSIDETLRNIDGRVIRLEERDNPLTRVR